MSDKSIFQKIKEHGIVGSAQVVGLHIAVKINELNFYRYQKQPIDEHLIVMESEGDLSDNAYALYDYMRANGYLNKYHVAWLVDDVEKAEKRKAEFPNTEFVQKVPLKVNTKWSEVLATCKWYIYDHCNLMAPYTKGDNQTILYLSHGWGYKASKGGDINKDKSVYDYMTATGHLSAKGLSEYWKRPLENTIITGYPRLDYFFENDKHIRSTINEKWKFDQYNKVIFWMPTFRKSVASALSEDYIKNSTGLPIFEDESSLKKFSSFLKDNNILFVFKLHHLQADLPVFHEHFDNILVVQDEELQEMGVQLYQFIPFADALVSDYSSISIDYLLLDRPIIYTLDDYDQYDKSRGLFPKNAIDYMPGYHVYNQKELEEAILELNNGIDKYKADREKVIDNYHMYKDGNSSKRVLDAVGIKM